MSASPVIDFTSIAGRDVFAFCSGMPASSRTVLVNKTSGDSAVGIAASDGPVTVTLPVGLPAGDYYLKAEDSAGGYLAQSVSFYVSAPGDSTDPISP